MDRQPYHTHGIWTEHKVTNRILVSKSSVIYSPGFRQLRYRCRKSAISVVRPVSDAISPTNADIYLPLSDSLTMTGVITDAFGETMPGATVQYQWNQLDGSPPTNTVIANSISDANGNVTTNVPMPAAFGIYSVTSYIQDAENNILTLGTSGKIHVGFLTPTINAGTPTATTIPLVITDPNIPNSIPSLYYLDFSTDGVNWTTIDIPASGQFTTSYTLIGLTPSTNYQVRVRDHVVAFDNKDDFSSYSGIITVSTTP